MRHLLISRDGGAWGSEPEEDSKGTICLRIADFNFAKGCFKTCDDDELTHREYTDTQMNRLALKYGDILIEKSGGGEKTPVGRAVLYKGEYGAALFANFMERLRFNTTKIMAEYIEYWLRAWYACKCSPYYINQTTGIQNINLSLMLSRERVFFPSMDLQYNIVRYLDSVCAEIDALAADIQVQIDTLEQYKRSVITEAITKGLNPDVEMACHQISWIEQMPAHWEIIPSKYLFHNSDKRKCEGDQQLTASQKHGIITQQEYMERENSKIVFANQGVENWKHVEPYDFVISLRSFQGGLEMSETTGCITWHYVVLKANKPICPRFYKWLFKSSAYINALQGTCNFIRDGQDLRFSNFAQVPLYEPPLSEQEDIASYLDMKCSQIDSISDQKKEQLTVLEAYKKSLIYEYVTGKKEVPVQ